MKRIVASHMIAVLLVACSATRRERDPSPRAEGARDARRTASSPGGPGAFHGPAAQATIALWRHEAADRAPVARVLRTSPPSKIMVLNANPREAHPHWIDDIRGNEGVGDLQTSLSCQRSVDIRQGPPLGAPPL